MCRINPKVDLVFKKLFGSEENKDLLKSLVNSLLPESQQAVEIHLKNPYNLADYIDGKLSILDIKAVDGKGKWYDIEMQVEGQGYYGQRAMRKGLIKVRKKKVWKSPKPSRRRGWRAR